MRYDKKIVKPDRTNTTTRRMRIAFWIPKGTYPHSEYVIANDFTQQQWSRESA